MYRDMKKIFLSIIAVLVIAAEVQAKPVGRDVAARLAGNVLQKQVVDATPAAFTECYLFVGADGKGFALVSADDCVRPLLGYSMEGSFDAEHMPAHVAAWIDGYQREIASVVATGVAPSPKVMEMWENPMSTKDSVRVYPLLTTQWGQGTYYNNHCPYDSIDSAYSVTGCVATAMAQIMRYWEYPAVGWSSHSYNHPVYGVLSAVFDTTHYRWDLMPGFLTGNSSTEEVEAVSTLMHHAGVAVEMNYSPRSSGAQVISRYSLGYPCAENAFKTYFRYNPMLYGCSKGDFSDMQWANMLRAELDAARPVLYCGYDANAGGHAFVIEGYDPWGMFYVNWGWGGYYDAYYTVDSLSPGLGNPDGATPYVFSIRNAAIFGVCPATPSTDSVTVVDIVSNDSTMGTVLGNGTYQNGDTVFVLPQAAAGCRYVGMTSGCRSIPFSFLAGGGTITDTAIFERIEGDTVQYSSESCLAAWRDDYGNTTEWGIRIPASMRKSRQLVAVQIYSRVEGDHVLNIYQGDSINGATPVYTGVYSLGTYSDQYDSVEGWHTLPLDSVLTFYQTQTIWITISSTDTNLSFPLACSNYCGNDDGSYYHLPEGWMPYTRQGVYYTWMVRAIFDPHEQFNVVATPNDITLGDVYGMGSYHPGDTVTLHALPTQFSDFDHWSNGCTDNPMSFIITRDTALTAFFLDLNAIEEPSSVGLIAYVDGHTVFIVNPGQRLLEIYDIKGRLLFTSHSPNASFPIPVPGVYLLKADGLQSRRFVIK